MAIGTLVGAQVQDTTTTTGTGAITLANVVPAGSAAGSTTFAAQFAPTGVFPAANIFYMISDSSGNIEVGLGTLTSATNLTRDYVLGAYTGGSLSLLTQTLDGSHVAFAAGTKNVFSNTNLFATSVAVWQRIPDDNAANIFQAVMSGTFTATVNAGSATSTGTVRFKISNEGVATLQIPTITATAVGTTLTVTGIPAGISSVSGGVQFPIRIVTSGAITIGSAVLTSGATPTSTGTLTISQYSGVAPFAETAVFTTAVVNGVQACTVQFPLF